jgi:hypothetical protein
MQTGAMFRVHRTGCRDIARDQASAQSSWTFGEDADTDVRAALREDFKDTYPEHADDPAELDGDIAACDILPCCEVAS